MEQKDSAERILKQIPYEIVYSARKTLAVQVKADGSVVVRAPKRMAKYKIEAWKPPSPITRQPENGNCSM